MVTNMNVKKNIGSQLGGVSLGEQIKAFRRDILGADQKAFARLLGVSQAIVSQWESGRYMPSAMALMAIGRIDSVNKRFWFEKAGHEYAVIEDLLDVYKKEHPGWEQGASSSRSVPLLRLSDAPMELGEIKPEHIERVITVPKYWLPPDGEMAAFNVEDDSMAPLLEPNFTVFVDISKRDPKKLLDKMVLAKDDEGVKIRWLIRDLGMYLLMPQDTQRHRMTELNTQKSHCVVGEVVKYIGHPTRSKEV